MNYQIKFRIDVGPFTKEEIEKDGAGGCDQTLLCSVINNPDGSASYLWVSSNGEQPFKEMDPYTQITCLSLLAKELSENEELYPGAREFCAEIFQRYRYAKQVARQRREANETEH
jgi:hypothetical protein